jgi:ribosomal subunit interface protein
VADGEIVGKTANSYREVLRRFFKFAKRFGYVCPEYGHETPVSGVEAFPENAPEITWLTQPEIDVQLETLGDHLVIHALVATYIYAGLRRAEALWLTVPDVNLKERLIRIRAKTVDGVSWRPKTSAAYWQDPDFMKGRIMDFDIQGIDIQVTEAIDAHVRARLTAALNQHQSHVARVEVKLKDVNGPRGGVDKVCDVVVKISPRGEVRVSKSDSDLYSAVSIAADAAKNAAGRELGKRKP